MNSIKMPAVIVNQMAENTGAVVRNFFMGVPMGRVGGSKREALSGGRR